MLNKGDTAPNFEALDQENRLHKLSDYRGKYLILYFYPRDMTSGCTVEACDFRDNITPLREAGAEVLGVSTDSVESHEKFVAAHSLNFPLLADTDATISNDYGVWVEKKTFGKEYLGIVRTTFIIDPEGKIFHHFPNVKVDGHVQQVLDVLTNKVN